MFFPIYNKISFAFGYKKKHFKSNKKTTDIPHFFIKMILNQKICLDKNI